MKMMMGSAFPAKLSWLVLASTAAATLASWPVWAQGTDAQREACAPDAIKLCSATIPDVPKTTACMKRHYAQLSPACRVAFDAAVPSGTPRNRVVTREPEAGPPPAGAGNDAAGPAPERVPGLRSYEAHIRQICREGLVDSFTCRNTLDLLQGGE